MRVVVVGAGPVGLFCAMVLARRGDDVVVVDRDAGPDPDGEWDRRGVMQFRHPHAFRPQVHHALSTRLPDVLDEVVRAGGIPVHPDGFPEHVSFIQCRRSTFEAALRASASREPRLALRVGHVDRFVTEHGRIAGVVVDGAPVPADLVICASGRSGRIAGDGRAPAEGGSCGFSYVSRMYRARPGVVVPPRGVPSGALADGYLSIMFPQDAGTICALVVRASTDADLAELRHQRCFDAAMAAIPNLAPYTDPEAFEPISPVQPGGGLTNTYRGQLDADGRVPSPGLLFLGDAVSTTNPAAGRGISLGLMQAMTMLGLLADSDDLAEVTREFDAWCTAQVRPWFDDHVYWDETLLRRFAGDDIDVDARIPSDVISAAAAEVPGLPEAAQMYQAMLALPASLQPYEERVRELLRGGWRPPLAEGPTRDELADVVRAAAAATVYPQRESPDALRRPGSEATTAR